jgi:putative SOS response-associated peptidase YedK
MCGRYGFGNPARFAELDLPVDAAARARLAAEAPRWNVAPSARPPVILGDRDGARLAHPRWGLVPAWAKDATIGARLANARGETIFEKPAFRRSARARRALVPVDLFYEWQAIPGARRKQPWCIRAADDTPFTIAALWDAWTGDDGPIETFAILTGPPDDVMAPIHDRMPVIVGAADRAAWLDPRTPEPDVRALVAHPAPVVLRAWRVGTYVNVPAHDDATCIAPLEA